MAFLELKGLTRAFGGLLAVNNVDLQVEEGTIYGIIGPNGAGKTTAFNLITGVLRPTRGQIVFNGQDITGLRPHQIAAKGLVRTFQASSMVFGNFSVRDNLRVARHLHAYCGLVGCILRLPASRKTERIVDERIEEVLHLTGLQQMTSVTAGSLPHGQQKMLGLAITLAAQPRLICLDEPATGMNPAEIQFILDVIRKSRSQGTTIVLVEHNMKVVMGICDRIAVLNFGTKIAEGTPGQIRNDETVIKAYLGDSVPA